MLAALLTTLLWSFSTACAHRSAKIIGGSEAHFWRLAVAVLALALWAHSLGGGLSGPSFSTFFMSGLVGIGLGDAAFFQALQRLGPRLTSLLTNCSSTLFAVIIEYLWLGTKLTLVQICLAGLVLFGVSLALKPSERLEIPRGKMIIGVAATLLAGLGTAFGAVLSRKAFALADDAGISMDGGTAAYQRLIGATIAGGLLLLIVKQNAPAHSKVFPSLSAKWKQAFPWVLTNAMAGQALGVSFFQLALKTAPTGVVLPIVALTPLVIIPFARFFENDRPSHRAILGSVIAVAGVIGLIVCR